MRALREVYDYEGEGRNVGHVEGLLAPAALACCCLQRHRRKPGIGAARLCPWHGAAWIFFKSAWIMIGLLDMCTHVWWMMRSCDPRPSDKAVRIEDGLQQGPPDGLFFPKKGKQVVFHGRSWLAVSVNRGIPPPSNHHPVARMPCHPTSGLCDPPRVVSFFLFSLCPILCMSAHMCVFRQVW